MLAIRGGCVFDGTEFLTGTHTVLIEGRTIVGIDRADPPAGSTLIDVPHGTVMPGLIDSHVHLVADGGPDALGRVPGYDRERLDAVIEQSLRAELAAGITTLRDLGDHQWSVVDRRDRQRTESPDSLVPWITAAGPPITSVGGHCSSMGGEVEGAAQIVEAVRQRVERRVDVIKVMLSGGLMTAGTDIMSCQFSDDDAALLVREAHLAGLPVTAHAHGLPAIEQAIAVGVDGIEHCTCLTPDGAMLTDELIADLARAPLAVCPTFGAVPGISPPPAVQQLMELMGGGVKSRLELARRMYAGGVRLVAGSDAGINPSKARGILPMSVTDFVDAGLPAAVALATATSIAAEVCGVGTHKGRLRPTYDADLLVLNGDLRSDLNAIHDVHTVIVRGQPVVRLVESSKADRTPVGGVQDPPDRRDTR